MFETYPEALVCSRRRMMAIEVDTKASKVQRFLGVDTGGTTVKAAIIEVEPGGLPRLIQESIAELSSDVAKGPEYVIQLSFRRS
jgi:activator of 2-hydroxyglutaryl-CoA dehydratase